VDPHVGPPRSNLGPVVGTEWGSIGCPEVEPETIPEVGPNQGPVVGPDVCPEVRPSVGLEVTQT
jgi:hypothetical protein